MKVSRRKMIRLSGLGLLACTFTGQSQTVSPVFPWREVTKEWLNIFMPADEGGIGADCPELWAAIDGLMQEKEFSEGFVAGLKATVRLPKPRNSKELELLMSGESEVSQFLGAFFDLVLENFFGSEAGHGAVGVGAPQPKGYVL